MRQWIRMGIRRGIPLVGLFLVCLAATPANADDIDLSRYKLTFDENFDSLDVSAWGPGTRWIAHTAWAGDFGDAQFANPTSDFPFTVKGGVLNIEMKKDLLGKWQSGLLSTLNKQGSGFSQAMGYFEARAKFPPGKGVWPAFWLIGTDRSAAIPEIDIVEYYGQFPGQYVATVHLWKKKPDKSIETYSYVKAPSGLLSDDFHTYGVSIDQTNVTFYLDRHEVWRTPSLPEYQRPMALLVNLAAGAGWPITEMPNPSVMQVDYVRAYALK